MNVSLKNIWSVITTGDVDHLYTGEELDAIPSLNSLTVQEAIDSVKQKLSCINENSYGTPSIVFCGSTSVISQTSNSQAEAEDISDNICPEFYYMEIPLAIDGIPCYEYNVLGGYSKAPGLSAIVTCDGVMELVIYCSYKDFNMVDEKKQVASIFNILKTNNADQSILSAIGFVSQKYIGKENEDGSFRFIPVWAVSDQTRYPLALFDAITGNELWTLR